MITTTEDNFNVDYDIFSFAGRVALVAGGVAALDASIKEGHFKSLKTNKNSLKRNNEVIQTVKRAIEKDLQPAAKQQKKNYAFRETDEFLPTEDQIKKKKANKRIVAGVDSEIVMKDGSRKRVRDLFEGGFMGRSKDAPDELKRAQESVMAYDNRSSAPLTLTFDDNEKLQSVSIKTNSGIYDIPIVDKNSQITKGGSKLATRGVFSKSEVGYAPTKAYGADVAAFNFIAEQYGKGLGGDSGISVKEMNEKFSELTRNLDRDFGQIEVDKVNPMVTRQTILSSKFDPFKDTDERSISQIIMEAQKKGFTTGLSAEDINKSILYLEENPYKTPFEKETENPKQKHRANTKYRRLDGKEVYNENARVLYANEEMMIALKDELAKDGITFGDLGKEERLANKSLMGKVVDNSRSIEISNRKMSKASDFLINQLAQASGLSIKEFTNKLRENRGFDAFNSDQVKNMQRIGIDDYENYLKKQIEISKTKKSAYLKVNSGSGQPLTVDEAVFFNEAKNLKAQNKLQEKLLEVESELKNHLDDFDVRNVFGVSVGGSSEVLTKKKYSGLFINNLKLNENSIVFNLRRESDIRVGSKIHDPSGQEKATVKKVVSNLGEYITRAVEKIKGGPLTEGEKNFYNSVSFVGTDVGLKTEPELRNLSSVFLSIEQHAKESNNKKLLEIIENYRAKHDGMTDEENMKFWKSLKDTGISFADMQGVTTEAGYLRTSVGLAFGADNIDMGFGGPGFFSERHLRLFAGMGAGSYAEELVERRLNKGASSVHENLKQVQKLMKDSAKAGFINFEDLNKKDFFANIFNTDADEGLDTFEMRKKYLEKYKNDYGAVFFDLGEEIDGVSRIPIFTEESYRGYAGEQIGYKGDVRKFTNIENLTKKIALEARKGPEKNKEALKTLIKNYMTAISQMDENLQKAKYGGKFSESGYLVFKSATDELKEYSLKMKNSKGTKNYIDAIAQVSDKRFVEMFGPEALEEYKKTKISKAFGMVLREPADAAAALAMNYIPGGEADDALYLTEKALSMIGGDLDQDAGTAGAALRQKSIEQIEELVYGNTENSIKFRENMERRSNISLKGRGAKSIFDFSFEDQRRASFLGKVLEKGMVGKVSNAMSVVQQMNQRLNALSNPDKYHKTTLLVGLLVENTIKGKKQSMQELLDKRSYQMLDAIMGANDFNSKTIDERTSVVRKFLDELMLNKGSKFADRIRAGEDSADFVQEIALHLGGDAIDQSHYDEAKRMVNDTTFKDLTSDDTLGSIFEYSDASKEYKTILGDVEDQITEITEGKTTEEILRRAKLEDAQEGLKNVKKTMGKVGGNLAKYALIPAAGFGILGTVFGARSSISSDIEFSDNQKNHEKSGFKPFKPLDSINMGAPRHMKPEIRGGSQSGFQINNYAKSHSVSEMRIVDDTRNFDYFDMQDKVSKGY